MALCLLFCRPLLWGGRGASSVELFSASMTCFGKCSCAFEAAGWRQHWPELQVHKQDTQPPHDLTTVAFYLCCCHLSSTLNTPAILNSWSPQTCLEGISPAFIVITSPSQTVFLSWAYSWLWPGYVIHHPLLTLGKSYHVFPGSLDTDPRAPVDFCGCSFVHLHSTNFKSPEVTWRKRQHLLHLL